MIQNEVRAAEAVALLNQMMLADRPAAGAFIANRYPCCRALADHPSCPVYRQHGGYWVSGLMVLNGLFGIDREGNGPLSFDFEEEDSANFGSLAGFVLSPTAELFADPTLDHTVTYLNELVGLDKAALAALCFNYIPCNETLADHPTIQVNWRHGAYQVGLIGILNGLFGADGRGRGGLVAHTDAKTGDLLFFGRASKD